MSIDSPDDVRDLLAETIRDLDPAWTPTVDQIERNCDLEVQIGDFHPGHGTFGSRRWPVPLIFWANYANSRENSRKIYKDVQVADPDALIQKILDLPWIGGHEVIDELAIVDELPQFKRATVQVTVWESKLPESDES